MLGKELNILKMEKNNIVGGKIDKQVTIKVKQVHLIKYE